MRKIKKGDIVGRISYGKDVLFVVDKIIKTTNRSEIAILKGLVIRIKADSPIEDLEIIQKKQVKETIELFENKIQNRLKKNLHQIGEKRSKKIFSTGRILHLDGDTHLSNLKKCSNINTYKQVIFNHDLNNVSNY